METHEFSPNNLKPRDCPNCGVTFETTVWPARFCGGYCQLKHWREEKQLLIG